MEQCFAVDRVYFSGCWDSNGHEKIRTRRYHCDTIDDVRRLSEDLLSMSNTKAVKVLKFNRFRGCFEVFSVRMSGDSGNDNDYELTLPAGFVDRNYVQSTLFRLDGFEVIMAPRPKNYTGFWNTKLSERENRAINDRIRQSWKNGRENGRKSAFAIMYRSGRL